jgi:hypothetical protein
MNHTTFAEFESQAKAAGFDEVLERVWAPDLVVDTHSHSFAARVQVVQGELWLNCGNSTQHLQVGGGFELAAGQPHAERYGPQGATFWLARRHPH